MHPLTDNLKSLTYEELEKRVGEIHKRMQIMRRNQIQNPLIWDQLEALLASLEDEKRERAIALNSAPKQNRTGTVLSTDPLEEDLEQLQPEPQNKTFRPIS